MAYQGDEINYCTVFNFDFVEEVLQAGGTSAGLYSNCPTKETFK